MRAAVVARTRPGGCLGLYRAGCNPRLLRQLPNAALPVVVDTSLLDISTRQDTLLDGSILGTFMLGGFILDATLKALLAVSYASYTFRPRGWSLRGQCLDVRESTIPNAGKGVFATARIKQGTVLGAYPGIPRSDQEMAAKALVVPTARYYVFSVRPQIILDPTGMDGLPTSRPVPMHGWWPFQVDCTLSYVNEPAIGRSVNVVVEDDTDDALVGLCFVADRDIEAGEELFIDYGVSYDRTNYKKI